MSETRERKLLLFDRNLPVNAYNVNFFKDKHQLHRRCSVGKLFFKALQNLRENTCALFPFISGDFIKK